MKRRRFMGTVSGKALTHREITGNDVAKHKALGGLGAEFRESTKWFGPQGPTDIDGMVMRMVRPPHDQPNPTEGVSLVIVDKASHKGKPEEISIERMAKFWKSCLRRIRRWSLDVYTAGAAICDDLEVSVSPDLTAELLGLGQADAALTRAHQAALVGAFVSNPGTTDLETVNVAIASFVHAHPAFAHLVEEEKWHRPYGDRTAYMLLRQG